MMCFKTAVLAVALAAMSSNAFAADVALPAAVNGPLVPGKPAGVKQAQDQTNNTIFWILGAALVIGGIALVASGNGNSNTGQATTASGT